MHLVGKQEDRVELAQLTQMVGGEHPAAEVAPLTVVPAGISYIRLASVEADVLHLGKSAHVVGRPAAHIEDPVARLQLRLVEAAVADPVGADALLQSDVETGIAEASAAAGQSLLTFRNHIDTKSSSL